MDFNASYIISLLRHSPNKNILVYFMFYDQHINKSNPKF